MSDAKPISSMKMGARKPVRPKGENIHDAARLLRIISEGTVSPNTSYDVPDGLCASSADRGPGIRLLSRARAVLRLRGLRTHYFDHAMFSEPAWDILLMLYVSDVSQKLSHLVEGVESPPTTALRWIDYLENQQLVERTRHPIDQRLVLVGLTSKARDSMDAFLNEIF